MIITHGTTPSWQKVRQINMLSQKNIDKLCMTGLYRHEPDVKYRGLIYENQLFHCCNWVFEVKYNKHEGKYQMVDNFWIDGSGLRIDLTDDNINEFELIFDKEEVTTDYGNNIWDYDESDRFYVAIGSGGAQFCNKWFIKKDAKKNKDKVVNRLNNEIESLESELLRKKQILEKVVHGDRDLKYL